MPHSPGLGAIFGIVAENGVPVEGAEVRLLDRTGPYFLRTGLTKEDGSFVFSGLDPETDDYMAFVTDETSEGEEDPYRNALIQDRITPVPVHVGSTYPSSWIPKFKQYDPAVLFAAPHVDTRFNQIALLQGSSTANVGVRAGTGVISYTAASPFTETAFNLPTVTLSSDTVYFNMQGHYGLSLGDHVTSRFSMVACADFSKNWGFTQLVQCSSATTVGYLTRRSVSPILVVAFDGTDTIRAELCQLHTATGSASVYTWAPHSILKTYNTVLSSVPAGFETVAVAVKNGSEVWLYVGEESFLLDDTTVPIKFSGSNLDSDQNLFATNAAFHGWNRTGVASNGQAMALYMLTPYFLSFDEFTELRDSLLTPQFPNETGYLREITVDAPSQIYMLDEANSERNRFFEHYSGDASTHIPARVALDPALHLNTVLSYNFVSGDSPLLGRSGIVFPGTSCLWAAGVGVNYRNFTITGWLKQTARAAQQTIVGLQTSITSTVNLQATLDISTSGALLLYLAGTSETVTFTTNIPLDTWTHFAVALEKTAEKCHLYLDGVKVEELPLTTTAITYDQLSYETVGSPVSRILTIGGKINSTTTSSGFVGSLSAIALFPYPVPAYRIAAHYAAKDVV